MLDRQFFASYLSGSEKSRLLCALEAIGRTIDSQPT